MTCEAPANGDAVPTSAARRGSRPSPGSACESAVLASKGTPDSRPVPGQSAGVAAGTRRARMTGRSSLLPDGGRTPTRRT